MQHIDVQGQHAVLTLRSQQPLRRPAHVCHGDDCLRCRDMVVAGPELASAQCKNAHDGGGGGGGGCGEGGDGEGGGGEGGGGEGDGGGGSGEAGGGGDGGTGEGGGGGCDGVGTRAGVGVGTAAGGGGDGSAREGCRVGRAVGVLVGAGCGTDVVFVGFRVGRGRRWGFGLGTVQAQYLWSDVFMRQMSRSMGQCGRPGYIAHVQLLAMTCRVYADV